MFGRGEPVRSTKRIFEVCEPECERAWVACWLLRHASALPLYPCAMIIAYTVTVNTELRGAVTVTPCALCGTA